MMKKNTMKKRFNLKRLIALALTLGTCHLNAQIDLVQTTNNAISTSAPSCGIPGNITYTAEYARLYNLPALGYGKFEVTKVSFAIDGFQLGSAANFPVSVKVYGSTDGLVEANWTLVGQQSINITTSMVGTVVEVPLTTPAVVTTSEMVIVLSTPDGQATSSGFYAGANTSGQTAQAYIKASDCGVNQFTDFTTVGFSNTCMVLFPTGNPTAICPPGDVYIGSQAEADQFLIDYPNCTEINGSLLFQVNSGSSDLVDLTPFSNITSVLGSLQFNNNQELESIAGLENLTSVGTNINLYNNGIQNIDPLNGIETLGGLIYIDNNPALVNLNGFASLTEMGGDIYIDNNPALVNLNGFASLTEIGGYIYINNNSALVNLNGFASLTDMGGHIEISNNAILSDISGLENISPTWNETDGLIIVNNPALEVCNLPNFCTYLLNPASSHPRNISGNLANCLNEEAVITMCTLSLSDLENAQTTVYPNPVNDQLVVSNLAEINSVAILNMLGQTILFQEVNAFDTQINVSSLPNGNYFLRVTSEFQVETIKITKE